MGFLRCLVSPLLVRLPLTGHQTDPLNNLKHTEFVILAAIHQLPHSFRREWLEGAGSPTRPEAGLFLFLFLMISSRRGKKLVYSTRGNDLAEYISVSRKRKNTIFAHNGNNRVVLIDYRMWRHFRLLFRWSHTYFWGKCLYWCGSTVLESTLDTAKGCSEDKKHHTWNACSGSSLWE